MVLEKHFGCIGVVFSYETEDSEVAALAQGEGLEVHTCLAQDGGHLSDASHGIVQEYA